MTRARRIQKEQNSCTRTYDNYRQLSPVQQWGALFPGKTFNSGNSDGHLYVIPFPSLQVA